MLDTNTELDIIFNSIDDYLLEGKFNTVDLILSQVDLNNWPVVVQLGFLSSSYMYRDKLKYFKRLAIEGQKKSPKPELWKTFVNG